jgi:general secretion pathway protein L
MADVLILMMPSLADAPMRPQQWWCVRGDDVVVGGSGDSWPGAEADDRVIALVPAADAPVRWLTLQGLTPPQAATAARLQAAEAQLGDASANHVAAGLPNDDEAVPTAIVTREAMARWIAELGELDLSAAAIVPVAALVPPRGDGAPLRVHIGGEALLQCGGVTAAADAELDALRLRGSEATLASDADVSAWLAALAAHVPLNLRTGEFAARTASTLTASMQRWLVGAAAALLLVSFMVPVAQYLHASGAVERAEARALAAAKQAGIADEDLAATEAALDRKLAAQGGGPLALSAPLSGLYRSLQAYPAVALRKLSHDANGTLSVQIAAPRIEDVNAVLIDLQQRKFTVTAQPMQGSDGMQMGNITIRALP